MNYTIERAKEHLEVGYREDAMAEALIAIAEELHRLNEQKVSTAFDISDFGTPVTADE